MTRNFLAPFADVTLVLSGCGTGLPTTPTAESSSCRFRTTSHFTRSGGTRAPVEMSALTFAPGERLDLLVDFRQASGQTVRFRNGAFDILQFRVGRTSSPPAAAIPKKLRAIERIAESSATGTRTITLNECQDRIGNSTEMWEFVNLTEDAHPMHLTLCGSSC